MYHLKTAKKVGKRLSKDSVLRKRFDEWATVLIQDPFIYNDGRVKAMQKNGFQVYKKRLGKHRALFIINEINNTVFVFDISERGRSYKKND